MLSLRSTKPDEFQTFAGGTEGTRRELLRRGRKYGVYLTLARQFSPRLPIGLQDEIFGNVASIVAFTVSAEDAQAVRKEILELPLLPVDAEPVSLEALVTLRTGQAIARLGGGAYALKLQAAEPVAQPKAWQGEKIRGCRGSNLAQRKTLRVHYPGVTLLATRRMI